MRNGWRINSKNKGLQSLDYIDESDINTRYQHSFEDIVETREENRVIQSALDKLNLPMRTVVVLYYYEGMTVKEIAKIMGCFQGTVKSRLYHSRKLIKKELVKYFGQDSTAVIYKGRECPNNEI